MERYALFSVFYKDGIEKIAEDLVKKGYRLLSTGGTFKFLKEKGFEVKSVEELTKFPESPGGRVKTLHPAIFAGILARRDREEDLAYLKENNLPLIDFVLVNLYPFEEKRDLPLDELLEFIDIGGVSLIRAAAKNYRWVTIICDPEDYSWVAEKLGEDSLEDGDRRRLALKAFKRVLEYDNSIYNELSKRFGEEDTITFIFEKWHDLRYGENPHQRGSVYVNKVMENTFIKNAELLWGIELSYNNILDAYSSWNVVREFEEPAVCIVKHNIPCGVGVGDNIAEAYEKALKSDEESAFGGIVAFNRDVDEKLAERLNDFFFDLLIALEYSSKALEILKKKKKRRVVRVKSYEPFLLDLRFIDSDLLVQERDFRELKREDINVVAGEFREEWFEDVVFGDKVVKHVKSNAIVLVKDGMTVGIGGGQTSRVESLKIALERAGDRARDSILVSDGFFPFTDSIELSHRHGVKLVVEPGGSVRDEEVISRAKELGLNLVFTGIRRFRH